MRVPVAFKILWAAVLLSFWGYALIRDELVPKPEFLILYRPVIVPSDVHDPLTQQDIIRFAREQGADKS